MKAIKWGMAILIGILCTVVIFFTNIQYEVFFSNNINRELEKLNIAENIKTSPSQLNNIMDKTLMYLSGDLNDLTIYANIDGKDREVYNDKEKKHMVDVKELFIKGTYIKNISFILLILLIVVLYFTKKLPLKHTAKGIQIVFSFIILSMIILGILFMIDFNKYFTIFHHMFFDNDLWLLNPKKDLLINIVPEQFFFNVAIRLVITFFVELVVGIILAQVIYTVARRE